MSLTKVSYSMITGASVNVLDFIPAGFNYSTTDCSAYIQAAIDSLSDTTGGTVYFPVGVYAISNSISIAEDAISLVGEGTAIGGPGASNNGASVIRTIGSCNVFNVTSVINNFTIKNLYINSTVTTGYALNLSSSGNITNLYVSNVFVQEMLGFLHVSANGIITHALIEFCQFAYNTGNHVLYDDGAILNSITFDSCKFEPAGQGFSAYRAYGTSIATGQQKFIHCVIESIRSARAMDLGANAIATSFYGCHFENNASQINGVAVNNGCDIFFAGGQSNILVENCSFSYPFGTATNFINVNNSAFATVTCISNTIAIGTNSAGFVKDSLGLSTVLMNNVYVGDGVSTVYTNQNVTSPTIINELGSIKFGNFVGPIVKFCQTTDATPTKIWGELYQFQASSGWLITANVIGVNASGAVYSAFMLRSLITSDATNATTIRGSANEIPIVSGAQNAEFVLTGSTATAGLELRVTGIASTTIRWQANIQINRIGF
jgi:hypothetical protein